MTYYTPKTLPEAIAVLQSEAPTVLAGGTDVFAASQKLALQGPVLDVTRVQELGGITLTEDSIEIGACATWSDVANANLPPMFRGLQDAARQVGGIQIQNRATLVGNICNASPAADGVPPLLTLDASVRIAGAFPRSEPLSAFIMGPRKTSLQPGEMVSGLSIPRLNERTNSAFEKLGSRAYLVISIAMVAAVVELDSDGCIAIVHIAIGACSPVAMRLPSVEAALIGVHPRDVSIDPDHLSDLSPIDDPRGTADYRRDAVRDLCETAIRRAAGYHG